MLVGPTRRQPTSDQIIIYANQVLAPVSPLLFGQNYGPWMHTSPEYVADYQQLGLTLLRYPAGNYGDENDLFPNNLDDLAMLAEALEAEVSVQARLWREGTPEKAAELVRYSNIDHDYGFRYWEVGNEPDLYMGLNRNQRKDDPVFDVDWYNQQFRAFAQAMKAEDPDIQIVGPVVTGGWREWLPPFFKTNGDIVDVVSWHWYAHGNELSDAEVLATPPEIEEQVRTIREWWADPETNPLGHERPAPLLFLSEYSSSWASGISRHLGSQVDALWNAEVVGRLANLGVEMGAHFALQGTRWHGMLDGLKQPRPVYGIYQLYSRWGNQQVAVQSSDEALLPAFASLREDGSLAIIVINKDPERSREVALTVEGFHPAGPAQVWLQDETHLAEPLPTVTVTEAFTYTFPPYSVTLLILEPARANWFFWGGIGVGVFVFVGLFVLGIIVLWRRRR
jgi:hypothetical protein